MDIEEEVRELIDCHGESDYLDFKEEDYHKENKVEPLCGEKPQSV